MTTVEASQELLGSVRKLVLSLGYKQIQKAVMAASINALLIETYGNKVQAARLGEMHRNTLDRMVDEVTEMGAIVDIQKLRESRPWRQQKFGGRKPRIPGPAL